MGKLKDKIILVHYISIGNIDFHDVEAYVTMMANKLKTKLDDDEIHSYFIPIRDGDSRIECINPKLVSDEFYEEVLGVLDNAHKAFDDLTNQLNETVN